MYLPICTGDDARDTDADGISNAEDLFPNDPCASEDTDGDRKPDVLHENAKCSLEMIASHIPAADEDDDEDGVDDIADAFPKDKTESQDSDGDGIGDRRDSCRHGNEGWRSVTPADFVLDSLVAVTDNDADGCQDDTSEDLDKDNDGVPDLVDLFPTDSSQSGLDSDSDGIDNTIDIDEDGDGLIEISSIEMLYNMRYVPDGTGYKSSEGAMIVNKTGCGGQAGKTECDGYELDSKFRF